MGMGTYRLTPKVFRFLKTKLKTKKKNTDALRRASVFPLLFKEITMKKIFFVFLSVFFTPAFVFAGQSSQSSSGSNSSLNAPIQNTTQVEVSPTFQASKQIRQFPNGPGMILPSSPNAFFNPQPGGEFQSFKQFITLKDTWTEGEISCFKERKLAGAGLPPGFGDKPEAVKVRLHVVEVFPPTEAVKFAMGLPITRSYKYVGQVLLLAPCGGTSEELFMVAAQKAMAVGGNFLVLAAEGSQAYLTTSAWGISLGYVHVNMGGGQNGAGAGAIGIGYAKGETEYNHKPFTRFVILRVK